MWIYILMAAGALASGGIAARTLPHDLIPHAVVIITTVFGIVFAAVRDSVTRRHDEDREDKRQALVSAQAQRQRQWDLEDRAAARAAAEANHQAQLAAMELLQGRAAEAVQHADVRADGLQATLDENGHLARAANAAAGAAYQEANHANEKLRALQAHLVDVVEQRLTPEALDALIEARAQARLAERRRARRADPPPVP